MALTATVYNLSIELADVDRGVYEKLNLRIARQPSETPEYMLTRILAYCLEYTEGMTLTEGVAAGGDPAVLIRDLTGRTTAWIEVGLPDADRVSRGLKLAGRAAIYTHRDAEKIVREFTASGIRRLSEVPVYSFDKSFIGDVAALIERRSELTLSITEREMYVSIAGRSFHTTVVEHRC
jgi:uncharacterized protein YaeQ